MTDTRDTTLGAEAVGSDCEPHRPADRGAGDETLESLRAELDRALDRAREAETERDKALANLAEAWEKGYIAGNEFGWESAQDCYDGPIEDPTENPYSTDTAAGEGA